MSSKYTYVHSKCFNAMQDSLGYLVIEVCEISELFTEGGGVQKYWLWPFRPYRSVYIKSYENASGLLAVLENVLRYRLNVLFNCNERQSVSGPHRHTAAVTLFLLRCSVNAIPGSCRCVASVIFCVYAPNATLPFYFSEMHYCFSSNAGHYVLWHTEQTWILQSSNSKIKSCLSSTSHHYSTVNSYAVVLPGAVVSAFCG